MLVRTRSYLPIFSGSYLCIYLFCRIELAFNIAFNMLKRKDALFVWLL